MSGERILVVDDEKAIRDILSMFLPKEGYDFKLAVNGEDALLAIGESAGNFDLIISDIDMPRMNGIEMAQNITRKIPIIFMSGRPSSLERVRLTNLPNFAGAVGKPFSLEDLSNMIKKTLA
ncbi:MAG: response regulator [Candidatus Moranbacteria bacterium]|nr:response regulator [Candidatus Moranbacteria bacterium]